MVLSEEYAHVWIHNLRILVILSFAISNCCGVVMMFLPCAGIHGHAHVNSSLQQFYDRMLLEKIGSEYPPGLDNVSAVVFTYGEGLHLRHT